MDVQSAKSRSVVASYRRVTYEVVEELSDALFWLLVITSASLLLIAYIGWQGVGVLFLDAIPILYFLAEILRWKNEKYTIFRTSDGYGLEKKWGIFNVKGVRELDINKLTDRHNQGPIGMLFDFERVTYTSPSQGSFIEGQRMPTAFRRHISRLQTTRPRTSKIENDDLALLDRLGDLVLDKLLDPGQARHAAGVILDEYIG